MESDEQKVEACLLDNIIGLSLSQADNYLEVYDFFTRVVTRDGKAMVVTRDYNINRVNVHIQQGKITGWQLG